ncbi:MAG: GNAT family N-acetyltransferase [Bacillota bacterium]|nr:GNAT family N-acetyltransferase [Bacillota bacterium]
MPAGEMMTTARDCIIEIEKKITGQERKEYWTKKLELFTKPDALVSTVEINDAKKGYAAIHLFLNDKNLMVAAEADGKLCGFMFGHIKEGEFGSGAESCWMEILGVDPKFQGKGIGKQMAKTFSEQLRKMGINTIYTLVNWQDTKLIPYFTSLGFVRADFMALQKEL